MAASTVRHIFRKDMSQLRQRDHVQLQHVCDAVLGLFEEWAVFAKAGVVNQDIDRNASVVEPGLEFRRGTFSTQVDSFYDRLHKMLLPKFLRHLLHRGCPPRCEHDARFPFREKPCELNTETA